MRQTGEHADKIIRHAGQQHRNPEEAIDLLLVVAETDDVLLKALLADEGAHKGLPEASCKEKATSFADENADVVVDKAHPWAEDDDTDDQCDAAGDDGDDALHNLQQNEEQGSPGAGACEQGLQFISIGQIAFVKSPEAEDQKDDDAEDGRYG